MKDVFFAFVKKPSTIRRRHYQHTHTRARESNPATEVLVGSFRVVTSARLHTTWVCVGVPPSFIRGRTKHPRQLAQSVSSIASSHTSVLLALPVAARHIATHGVAFAHRDTVCIPFTSSREPLRVALSVARPVARPRTSFLDDENQTSKSTARR